jgi:hypothetical protein
VVRKTAHNAPGTASGSSTPANPRKLFAGMIERLRSDALWATEYQTLVRQVSFARPDEEISFAMALLACERIAAFGL